ncbi:MAG: NAD(P)-binding oxidoreductase [Patescibacteria group bacterium]
MIPQVSQNSRPDYQRVLIFGASGRTGRHLLSQALERGFTVTAFVRHPEALPIQNQKLVAFTGDVLDAGQVAEAIRNQDAVISVLGNPTRQAIRGRIRAVSEGTKNIIAGMTAAGVRRLVFVTAFGVSTHIFYPEKLFIRLFLKNLFADLPDQERLIRASNLDWTIVRPARLTNGPLTGACRSGKSLYIHPFSKISRADVAGFLLRALDTPETIGQTLTISS